MIPSLGSRYAHDRRQRFVDEAARHRAVHRTRRRNRA